MALFGILGNEGSQTSQVSGLSKEQQALMSSLNQYLLPNVFSGQYQNAMNTLLSGQPAYDYSPETAMNFYRTNIQNPLTRQFQQSVLPGIREGYKNLWSSGRINAEQNARENLSSQLAAGQAKTMMDFEKLRGQSYENALQRMLGGLRYSPESLAAQLLGRNQMETIVQPGQGNILSGILGPGALWGAL